MLAQKLWWLVPSAERNRKQLVIVWVAAALGAY
jgi:hypothetical protein